MAGIGSTPRKTVQTGSLGERPSRRGCNRVTISRLASFSHFLLITSYHARYRPGVTPKWRVNTAMNAATL